MTTPNAKLDRRVRIELLRARAALERQEMAYLTRQIGSSMQPENIMALFKGRFSNVLGMGLSGTKTGHWLDFALSFHQRYPLLLSGVSALASSVLGKKKWRLGAAAFTAWRLFSSYQATQQRKKDRYVQAKQPASGRVIGPF